jgi:hypothetical protein
LRQSDSEKSISARSRDFAIFQENGGYIWARDRRGLLRWPCVTGAACRCRWCHTPGLLRCTAPECSWQCLECELWNRLLNLRCYRCAAPRGQRRERPDNPARTVEER